MASGTWVHMTVSVSHKSLQKEKDRRGRDIKKIEIPDAYRFVNLRFSFAST